MKQADATIIKTVLDSPSGITGTTPDNSVVDTVILLLVFLCLSALVSWPDVGVESFIPVFGEAYAGIVKVIPLFFRF